MIRNVSLVYLEFSFYSETMLLLNNANDGNYACTTSDDMAHVPLHPIVSYAVTC